MLKRKGNKYYITEKRKEIVHRYCLLDSLAVFGHAIPSDKLTGNLLVPGFSTHWGLPQNQLVSKLLEKIPALRQEWKNLEVMFNDIQ